MNLGGPVWHASASLGSPSMNRQTRNELEASARRALKGVGDSRQGEWVEVGRIAIHVRRRLSEGEQEAVGPVVDIRGTPEATRRLAIEGRCLLEALVVVCGPRAEREARP